MDANDVVAKPAVRRLVEDLTSALGADLVSVALYGSGARGDYEEATSDLNVIVVCRDLDLATLDRLMEPFERWSRAGHPTPRLLSPDIIASAADVFPIEFLDLRHGRRILAGTDAFAALAVDTSHLRHQCERELREKLMRLREGYVETSGEPKLLRALLIDSFGSFAALFRGCLYLIGHQVPAHNDDVVSAFCAVAGMECAPFLRVAALRPKKDVPDDLPSVFASYYQALTTVVNTVDRFNRPPEPRRTDEPPPAR